MKSKFSFLIIVFLSFFLFFGSAKAIDRYEELMTVDMFSGYYILENSDLIIINNELSNYYQDDDSIKVAFVNKYWYINNFDSENYYIFVFDYKFNRLAAGDVAYPGFININDIKNNTFDIFNYNLNTKQFVLSNLTYYDLVGVEFSLNINTCHAWFTGAYSYSSYLPHQLYFPLWIKGDIDRSNFAIDNYKYIYDLKFSSNLIFNDNMMKYYNVYDYFVGDDAFIHSYIDYLFGTNSFVEVNYSVNYYFDNILNEDLSYIGSGYVGDEVSVTPENMLNNYILSNDNTFSIVLSLDSENVINIYYVPNPDINTTDSSFYFFINFDDLKEVFPYVDFASFNQFEQMLVLVVVNIFFLLFWIFIIWIVLKMVYKFFQWI